MKIFNIMLIYVMYVCISSMCVCQHILLNMNMGEYDDGGGAVYHEHMNIPHE